MGGEFRLPDLGEGLHEAEIVAWHVGVGDRVVPDQPLVSVETDKALVEIPCPQGGYVATLHGGPGDVVAVGAVLAQFTASRPSDAGSVVGDLGAGRTAGKATPAVRRLAATLGLDLAEIRASGPDGTISREDVERAATAAGQPTQRLHGVRRAMFGHMGRAGREVVRATLTDDADINAWEAGADLTLRLIRALAAGCRASPSLNAWLDAAAETFIPHATIDLALAMHADGGLYTPVLRDVASRSGAEIRAEIDALKLALAERSLERERFTSATITLSNFGQLGGRYAEMVIVPPQVAILGAGQARLRPVVASDGRLVAHRVLPLSVSIDHRAVTGAEAADFLGAVRTDLEQRE